MSSEKPRFHPQPESTVRRKAVFSLAATQPEQAFAIAKTIPDGLYRGQAMTEIARHTSGLLAEQAFKAARAAAAADEDGYRQATVLVRALLAALEGKRQALAMAIFGDILALAPRIAPMASRAAALHWLWEAVDRAGTPEMRQALIDATLEHCHPDRSWRAARLYREMVARLDCDSPEKAEELIAAMPAGKARSFIARRRAEGERSQT